MKKFEYYISTSLILVLSGCTSVPKYQINKETNVAKISSDIFSISSMNTSTNIYIKDGEQTFKLFMLMGLKESIPAGKVNVEADKSFTLTYDQRNNSEYCTISINVIFQKNYNYQIVGGYGFNKGIFPFLPGRGNCKFGIREIESGQLIGKPLLKK